MGPLKAMAAAEAGKPNRKLTDVYFFAAFACFETLKSFYLYRNNLSTS